MGDSWWFRRGGVWALFGVPSLVVGASVADCVLGVVGDAAVDVRVRGVRVRVADAEQAAAVTQALRGLGVTGDPSGLQELGVVIESPQPEAVTRFWQLVTGLGSQGSGVFRDPWGRAMPVRVSHAENVGPLRDRFHVDVSHPSDVGARVGLGSGAGPYGLRHADPDGNEVDVVPGEPLPGATDWQEMFTAQVCYRTSSSAQQQRLVRAVASAADATRFPLLIDLRPGAVVLGTGKDQADPAAHGLGVDFTTLAAQIQEEARGLGTTPEPPPAPFMQLVLDGIDDTGLRRFWAAVLEYVPDSRGTVTDIFDPLRFNPELVFQDLDPTEAARRAQRNRIHLELTVPTPAVDRRVAVAESSGGQVLARSHDAVRICDPEGNELVIRGE